MDKSLHAAAVEELEAEIAKKTAEIAELRRVRDWHATRLRSALPAPHRYSPLGTRIPETVVNGTATNQYSDMTQRDAAVAVLKAAGKPLSTSDIANAMIAGGCGHDGNTIRNSVYAALHRDPETFVRKGEGRYGLWALTEWNPVSSRD